MTGPSLMRDAKAGSVEEGGVALQVFGHDQHSHEGRDQKTAGDVHPLGQVLQTGDHGIHAIPCVSG